MPHERGVVRPLLRGCGHVALGPWPFYPLAIAGLVLYAMVIRAVVRVLTQGTEGIAYPRLILPNLVVAVAVAAAAWAAGTLLPRLIERIAPLHGHPGGRGRYALTVFGVGVVMTVVLVGLVRRLLPDGHSPVQAGVSAVAISTAVVVLVTVILANGLAGCVTARFRREEALVAERLEHVREERTMQLDAEERVRAEAARYLHDDVQTALLRASLRLVPLVARTADPADQALLRAAIAEIDTVRDEGVRNVGRRLSPPLSSTGLIVALSELATSYAGVMAVEVEFDAAASERFRIVAEDDRVALAAYRLAEQALQNALKHGRATHSRVMVTMPEGNQVTLLITADGLPPAGTGTTGNGTAIINAWLGDVGGTWSLDAGDDGGSRFWATIGDDARSE